jgi:spore coat polysaccharide biosynthesis protein SpsF (cytidylyltransferase family)
MIITQARFGSSRLPGKVLKPIADKTLLGLHLERASQSVFADMVAVATTHEEESKHIEKIATECGAIVHKGDLNDVLDRFYQTALPHEPDYVVRITSDCPLIDAEIIDDIIQVLVSGEYDYVSNVSQPTFPDGMDVEAFTFSALEKAWKEADKKSDREHVTPYIRENSDLRGKSMFKGFEVSNPVDLSSLRLTVDEPADYDLMLKLVERLGHQRTWRDYVIAVLMDPELQKINQSFQRNEGYQKSLSQDD